MKWSNAALKAKFEALEGTTVEKLRPEVQEALAELQTAKEHIQKLESWAGAVGSILGRGFWGRQKWFWTGK